MTTTDDRVEITPERLATLERLADALPDGWWHAIVGSGHNICTALANEDDHGDVTLLADFDPDWFYGEETESATLPDHRAMLDYVAELRPRVVRALVVRIRELESENARLSEYLWFCRCGDAVKQDDEVTCADCTIYLERPS